MAGRVQETWQPPISTRQGSNDRWQYRKDIKKKLCIKRLAREVARQDAQLPLNRGSNVTAASFLVHEKHLNNAHSLSFPSFRRLCALTFKTSETASFEAVARCFLATPMSLQKYYRVYPDTTSVHVRSSRKMRGRRLYTHRDRL